MHKVLILSGLLFFTQLVFAKKAQAYLDPGTGSYLIQILVASVAALGLAASHFRDKIKSLIFKKNAKPETKDDA